MGTASDGDKNRKYFGCKSAVCLATGGSFSKGGTKNGLGATGTNEQKVINVNVLAFNECVPVLVLLRKWALVKDVVEAVCFALGVHEQWYFGLTLSNQDQLDTVLPKEKRLFDVIDPHVEPKLSFAAHFYPEDCSNIIQSVSVDLIYYEICLKINQSSILCPKELLVELAALSLAVLYPLGDGKEYYDAVKYKILPQVHLENVPAHKVLSNYESMLGKSPADYKRSYLKRAEALRMYGSSYFNVAAPSGEKWCLSVNSKGIALCLPAQKLEPFTKVLWLEIKSTCYKDCKFTIVLQPGCQRSFQVYSVAKAKSTFASKKRGGSCGNGNELINDTYKEIVFFSAKKSESRQIMYLLSGNHELYHRHRKNESVESKFIRKREQRNLLNANTVFEQLKLLSSQVASLNEDLCANNEDKEQLKRDLDASLIALRRVQTAAACLENNCSSFAEENYLLRSYIQNIPPHRSTEYQSRPPSANSTTKKVSSSNGNFSEERNVHSQMSPRANNHNNVVDRNHNFISDRTRLYDSTHNGISVAAQNSNRTNTSQCLSGYGKSSSVQELRPTTLASKVYPQYSFNLPRHSLNNTMMHTNSSNGLLYPQSTTMAAVSGSTGCQNYPECSIPAYSSNHYANLHPSYNQCLNHVNTPSSNSHYQNMPSMQTSSDNQANSFSTRNQQNFSSPNHNRAESRPNEYENNFGISILPSGIYLPENATTANNRAYTTAGHSGMMRMTPANNAGVVNSTSNIPSSHILPNRPDLLATSRNFESNSSTLLSRSRLAVVKKTSRSRKANSLDRLSNETGAIEEKMPNTGRRSYMNKNLRPSSSLTGAAFFGQREDEERAYLA